MARNKKPTAVLKLVGAFEKNPQRERPAEPEPTGEIGAAPKRLNQRQRKIWDEVLSNLPPGVAANSDRIALELLVMRLDTFRQTPAVLTAADTNQLISLLSRFGMTPADRSRINVKKPGEKGNAFD